MTSDRAGRSSGRRRADTKIPRRPVCGVGLCDLVCICVPRSASECAACGTSSHTGAASGSGGSRRCSITTAARSDQPMTSSGLSWLAAQPLPDAARKQIRIALSVIDVLDRWLGPLDNELRAYARRQVAARR